MEQLNHEPEWETWRRALLNLPEEQALQFTPDGMRLLQFVDTGETGEVQAVFGQAVFSFSQPKQEPLLVRELNTPEELLEDEWLVAGTADRPITDPDYLSWKAALPLPEDLQAVATEQLQDRTFEKQIACGSCQGLGLKSGSCSCTYSEATFDDDDEDEAEGVADPECVDCEGTGKYVDDCTMCQGIGHMTKYPVIKLVSEESGAVDWLSLDLMTLVASGELPVEWQSSETTNDDQFQSAGQRLMLRLDQCIERRVTGLGAEPKDTAIVTPDGQIIPLETSHLNIKVLEARWSKRQGAVRQGMHDGRRTRMPRRYDTMNDVNFDDLQRKLAAERALYGRALRVSNGPSSDEDEVWQLRPLRPVLESFQDLQSAAWARGTTLGYRRDYIATGTMGPAFYLFDGQGKPLHRLSADFTLREALENAWQALADLE